MAVAVVGFAVVDAAVAGLVWVAGAICAVEAFNAGLVCGAVWAFSRHGPASRAEKAKRRIFFMIEKILKVNGETDGGCGENRQLAGSIVIRSIFLLNPIFI